MEEKKKALDGTDSSLSQTEELCYAYAPVVFAF